MLGAGAVGLLGIFIWGLLRFQRRKAEAQAEAIDETGAFAIDGGLDFTCLPGPWPQLAQETLNPAGAGNVPSLPVQLRIADGQVNIDKKLSWGAGRHPFHAQVSLSHVVAVRVDRALHGISGSSLILELQNGQEVRIDVQLDAYLAEQVAGRIRVLLGSALRARPGDTEGVVVTSPFPPSRTPPARAGLLMMATFPPFAIAMAGAPNGPFADVATMTTMFYALWLMLLRPPTMARRLARFLFIGSIAFVADTVRTAQLARLAGSLTCLALAVWFLTIAKPGETSPTG